MRCALRRALSGEKPVLAFLDGLPPWSWAGFNPLGQSVLHWGTVMATKHQDSVSQRVRAQLASGWHPQPVLGEGPLQQSRSLLMP